MPPTSAADTTQNNTQTPPRLSEISLFQHFASAAIGGMVAMPIYNFMNVTAKSLLALPPTVSALATGALALLAGACIYHEHAVGATVLARYHDARNEAKPAEKGRADSSALKP